MSLLFRIVYAAHANGTHHKLALDGLRTLEGPQADAWTRLFLKHADRFMVGSKAPDDTFKDFKNHVLHVGDTYWGGAPEKVVEWYGQTVAALKEQRWEDAVYAAGVTSHYYTDPIMPFHTGQTDAENAIHRATEWSINRSYGVLRTLGEERFAAVEVPARDGNGWLAAMVCDGAETSHRSYERLIAHYDIHRGVTDPPAGLDGIARSMVAELLMYAATGFGRILGRALDESKVTAPDVSLTLDTILAAIKIPAKALAKRLSNAQDRAVVEAMYDELKLTGRVEKSLPEDDRVVRDLHAKEVLAPKLAKQAAERAARLKLAQTAATVVPKLAPAVAAEIANRTEAALTGPTPAPAAAKPVAAKPIVTPPAPPREQPAIASHDLAAVKPVSKASPPPEVKAVSAPTVPVTASVPAMPVVQTQSLVSRLTASPVQPEPVVAAVPQSAPPAVAAVSVPSVTTAGGRAARSYLAAHDQLEAAPSIGPKMADRFAALGIKTVGDFLKCDTTTIAKRLGDRRIDSTLLDQWKSQARLVMQIAGLRGTHAQLLTGAGYMTATSVADADPDRLTAEVTWFATTNDGKRLLRDGDTPDADKIKAWVELARAAAKAA